MAPQAGAQNHTTAERLVLYILSGKISKMYARLSQKHKKKPLLTFSRSISRALCEALLSVPICLFVHVAGDAGHADGEEAHERRDDGDGDEDGEDVAQIALELVLEGRVAALLEFI